MYWEKWGWYATLYDLAKGNILRVDKILKMNVYEVHTFLACRIDNKTMKAETRKQLNQKRR